MEKNQKRQRPGILFPKLCLVLFGPLAACQTAPTKSPKAEVVEPARVSTEKGDPVVNTPPWPNLVTYWENTAQGQSLLSQNVKYRAWDFNYDGRTDMLQVFDDEGKKLRLEVYDFDGDGVIDATHDYEYLAPPK